MEIELRFIGQNLPLLRESEIIPAEELPNILRMGSPAGDTCYTRHLTVFSQTDILFTAEDLQYESDAATVLYSFLAKAHKEKLIRILSINGVRLPDNQAVTGTWKEKELKAIFDLAKETDLSAFAVLRQGLRLYQMAHAHYKKGHRMAWVDQDGKLIPEITGGCMGD